MLFNPINNFKVLGFIKEREIEHSVVPLALEVTYIRLEYGGDEPTCEGREKRQSQPGIEENHPQLFNKAKTDQLEGPVFPRISVL